MYMCTCMVDKVRGPPLPKRAYEISNLSRFQQRYQISADSAKDFRISAEISRFHVISGEISRFPDPFQISAEISW